jgi:hypothetical protein
VTLNDIVTKAHQVDTLAAELAAASSEQTQGITQINVAVSQVDKVTQSNAANAEESAAAAQELNAQAEMMKQSIYELSALVSGKGAVDPADAFPAEVSAVNNQGRPKLGAQGRNISLAVGSPRRLVHPAETPHRK